MILRDLALLLLSVNTNKIEHGQKEVLPQVAKIVETLSWSAINLPIISHTAKPPPPPPPYQCC